MHMYLSRGRETGNLFGVALRKLLVRYTGMPREGGKEGTQPWAPGFRGPLQISIRNYLSVM